MSVPSLLSMMIAVALINESGQNDDTIQPQKWNAILQRMLNESYDSRVRPPASDEKGNDAGVEIEAYVYIRSMSNVDYVSMQYNAQLTLRQRWKDPRLAYNGGAYDYIVLTDRDVIWRPDTFFLNERRVHRHEFDKPNVLMRISPDGTVLYSQRLSLTLGCPMLLENFPMDVQECDLKLSSYGYTTDYIVYKWKSYLPVSLAPGLSTSMPSHTLDHQNTSICTSRTNTGQYSCLRVTFQLSREFRYYLAKMYIPSGLLVVFSWTTFWLDRASPARVTLLISSLLTIVIQAACINHQLPPVACITAIEVWIGACIVFIFAALLDHAFVTNVANKCDQRAKMTYHSVQVEYKSSPNNTMKESDTRGEREKLLSVSDVTSKTCCTMCHGLDKGEIIDAICRIIFPLAFIAFNITYWTVYRTDAR